MNHLLLVLLVVALTACGATPVPSSDAAVDASGADAATSDTGANDASVDVGADGDGSVLGDAASVEDAGDACMPESDSVLCAAASAECGALTRTDRCGRERELACGDCARGLTCGARGTANRCGSRWDSRVLRPAGVVGDIGMDLNRAGNPIVAYRSMGSVGELHVTESDGTSFTDTTLTSGALLGTSLSVASGSSTVIVASPSSSLSAEIFGNASGRWVSEPFPSTARGAADVALAPDGTRHLCIYLQPSSGFGGLLEHHWGTPAAMQREIVDGRVSSAESRIGNYCAISVAADGAVHIAYYDGQFGRLKHGVRREGVWALTVVDEPRGDLAGEHLDMQLSHDGFPRVSYRALAIGPSELRLATLASASWSTRRVEEAEGLQRRRSLRFTRRQALRT